MASSFLEIVELEGGEVVLKRADEEGEPLVCIKFSEESKAFIDETKLDVAKIMIQAGIQAAAQLNGAKVDDEASSTQEGVRRVSRTVH